MNVEQLEAAAAWRLRRDHGLTDAERSAFEAWLAVGDNVQALAQVDHAWDAFDEPDVVALERLKRETRMRLRRRRAVGVVGRIAATVVLAAGMGGLYLARQGEVHDNAGHGLKVVVLKDGSRLTLDAESSVKVRYSAKQRRFDLQRGQASFQVAHDPSRPFEVRVGDASVAALGTTFNINRWGAGATVALIEGGVRVEPDAKSVGVVLAPGQQVTVQAGRLSPVSATPGQAATAWRDGLLVFNDDSLDEALASVNRYGDREISLADSRLGALRISGIFKAGDTDAFARGVTELHGLRATVGAKGITLQRLQ